MHNITNRIKRVTINNFRGITHFTHLLNGENYNIVGENETYKTTKLQAIVWALNGKLLDGTSNIENLTPYSMPEDTETSVEIEFESGTTVKRTWQRKYVTNRESGERSLGVPTQTLYIDEVKQGTLSAGTKTILKELGLDNISSDIPKQIDMFMLLHVPRYLLNIEPKQMRELFEKIVGEPNLDNIVSAYPEDVRNEFAKHLYKYDTIKSVHERNLKELNSKKESHILTLNRLIEEKSKQVVVDVEPLRQEKSKLEKELLEIKLKESKDSEELVKDIDIKISKLNAERIAKRVEWEDKISALVKNYNDHMDTLNNKLRQANSKINDTDFTIKQIKLEIEQHDNAIKQLHNEYELNNKELSLLSEQFKEVITPTYVTAPISKERFDIYTTEEMKHIRQEKLDKLKKRGLEIKNKLNEIKESELEKKALKEVAETNLENIKVSKLQLLNNVSTIEKEIKDFERDDEPTLVKINDLKELYKKDDRKYALQLETLSNERKSLLETKSALDKDNANLKLSLETKIRELENQIISASSVRDYDKEIKETTKLIKDLENEIAFSEKIIVFVKKIERDKLVALEKRIEETFGDIYIKMFDFTQEGLIKSTFDIHVIDKNGYKTSLYQGLNNGALDIAIIRLTNKVREYFGVKDTFVLIDEISSLDNTSKNKLFALGQQVISSEVEK